jgi:hypothetical protein
MITAEKKLTKKGLRKKQNHGPSCFIRAWNRLSFLILANKKRKRTG